jgi:hypothetical protein
LIVKLGIPGVRLDASIELLDAAHVIRFRKGVWVPVSLDRVFGVRRIIAVEAKISNWGQALTQACNNQWFASESFVLGPFEEVPKALESGARRRGVGVWGCRGGQVVRPVRPRCGSLPISYVSWLFNEWVGRSLQFLW